ncbi:ABC transporter ATP-binding protein [Caldisericum sp.]|uniref:ABC transporter ATP-binding protein n=1 Tax=Caldisericum sp. TaxID=2499687 RepID=UPI003D143F83
MLRIDNLSTGYEAKEVLKEINLEFSKGFIYAILGPNGSGKSTLLRTIDRILKPKTGTVYLGDIDIRNLSTRDIAKRIAYLPQYSNSTPYISVFEAVLLGRKPYIAFEPSEKDLDVVEKIIKDFGLTDFAFRKINELSGGEVQKVLIARALTQEPEVLLLDEPVNHLDPKNQIEILQLLRKLTKKLNLITIIVLHDLNLAIGFADYFIFMKNGKIYHMGDSSIIEPTLLKNVYDINVKIIEVEGRKFVITLA